MLLLQIATRFSKRKGAVHPGIELLYIHAPSIWCTLQCIISWKRREIFFHRQILSILWFFMKVFMQNLVVPWEFLRNQWKNLSEYHSLNHDQKSLSKRHIEIYIWCQDTIGFQKGSLIEGEQDFIKSRHGSLKWFHFEKIDDPSMVMCP